MLLSCLLYQDRLLIFWVWTNRVGLFARPFDLFVACLHCNAFLRTLAVSCLFLHVTCVYIWPVDTFKSLFSVAVYVIHALQ